MISQESGSESPNVGGSDYSGDTEPVASDNEKEILEKEHSEPVASNNEEKKHEGEKHEEKDEGRECKHVGQASEQLDNQKSSRTDPSPDKEDKDDTGIVKSKTNNSQTKSTGQKSDSDKSDDEDSWSRPWLKWKVSHFYNSTLVIRMS